jgi:hypothetical protein
MQRCGCKLLVRWGCRSAATTVVVWELRSVVRIKGRQQMLVVDCHDAIIATYWSRWSQGRQLVVMMMCAELAVVGSHDAAMAAVGCGGESVAAVNCGDGAVTVVGCGCPVFPIGVVMLAPWQLTLAMQQ